MAAYPSTASVHAVAAAPHKDHIIHSLSTPLQKLRHRCGSLLLRAKSSFRHSHRQHTMSPSAVSNSPALPGQPSIVGLRGVMEDECGHVLVVMEYMQSDLHKWIQSRTNPLTLSEIKSVMKKILEGLEFLHGMGVMHWDFKPANILINNYSGEVKICDFGLSLPLSESGKLTAGVGTRWYKTPEIFLSHRKSTTAVNMWPVGCILAELLLRKALFPGTSALQQISIIHKTVGLSHYHLHLKVTAAVCSAGMPVLTSEGADLLEMLLVFDPDDRITATDALNHTWFREFYGFVAE